MKPNFALQLSFDGVQVLQRKADGWHALGAVRFDQADLDTRMAALLATARERAPDGVFSKLVMPDSEVRYATVLAPGPTDEARRLQIEAEIDGLTPYSADELAYDYVVEGDYALVAMAAREIMAEAEAFAVNHGFRPVSFVALPRDGSFAGEPFLGLSDAAADLIPARAKVERDAEPIRIVTARGRDVSPPQASQGGSPATGRGRADDAAGSAAAPPGAAKGQPGGQKPSPKPPLRPRVEITPANPQPPARPGDALFEDPPREGRVGSLVRRMGNRLRREQGQGQGQSDAPVAATTTPPAGKEGGARLRDKMGAGLALLRPGSSAKVASGEAAPAPSAPAAAGEGGGPSTGQGTAPAQAAAEKDSREGTRKAGRKNAEKRAEKRAERRAGRHAEKPAEQTTEKPAQSDKGIAAETSDTAAAPVTFSSRRRGAATLTAAPAATKPATPTPATPTASGPGQGARRDDRPENPGGRLAILPENRTAGRAASRLTGAAASASASVTALAGRIGARGNGLMSSLRGLSARRAGAGQAAPGGGDRPTRRAALGAIAKAPEPIVPESRPPADQAAKASEAEALTIFGARGSGAGSGAGGGARRGLMVAGGVLLLLLAVGVWALYFSGTAQRDTDIAALPADGATETDSATGIVPPEPLPTPDPDTATAADPSPEADAPLAEDGADPSATPDGADPAALLERLVEDGLREVSPAEILGEAAPTDLAEDPAPGEASPPDLAALSPSGADDTATAPDPGGAAAATRAVTLGFPAPVTIPPLEGAPLPAVAPPPPFGVTFDLGEDGLVEATPEGALTPGGITVFSGQPDVVPPVRPGGIAPPAPEPEAAPEPDPEPEPTAAAAPDDTPRADPALADARPEPRSPRVQAIGEELARERAAQQEEDATEAEETTPETPADNPAETPSEAPGESPADDGDQADAGAAVSPGGVSLAALRPQRRPTDLVPPAAAEDPVAADDDALPQAVARSLVPDARPADMAERVAQALAAARRTPEPTPAAAAPAAGPRIPTRASVADAATQRGLNLRRINLVGVHGTPSARRAMVRLANGRVVVVSVGDRLDGGQVAAIGDSELRYVRNGRNQVLRIGG